MMPEVGWDKITRLRLDAAVNAQIRLHGKFPRARRQIYSGVDALVMSANGTKPGSFVALGINEQGIRKNLVQLFKPAGHGNIGCPPVFANIQHRGGPMDSGQAEQFKRRGQAGGSGPGNADAKYLVKIFHREFNT